MVSLSFITTHGMCKTRQQWQTCKSAKLCGNRHVTWMPVLWHNMHGQSNKYHRLQCKCKALRPPWEVQHMYSSPSEFASRCTLLALLGRLVLRKDSSCGKCKDCGKVRVVTSSSSALVHQQTPQDGSSHTNVAFQCYNITASSLMLIISLMACAHMYVWCQFGMSVQL